MMAANRIACCLFFGLSAAICADAQAAAAAQPGEVVSAGEAQTGEPPERIDLTVTATAPVPRSAEACERQRDAAVISGEIVVCGNRAGEAPPTYSSREDADNRYADKTRNHGTLPTPDVAGPGIFRGPATVGGICVKGLFNCAKPPAVYVDVTALPQAPPGSDADRIARGLAPLGDEGEARPRQLTAQERAELGLPEPAAARPGESQAAAVSPEESAAPAAPQ